MPSDTERPAPARLKTVVLRAGPPPSGGRRRDAILGIAGVALLILATFLVPALPEEEVFLPQFELRVAQPSDNFTSRQVDVLETETADILYELPLDNVFFIQLEVAFEDDVRSSDADVFEVMLLDPRGNRVSERVILENPLGEMNTTQVEPTWDRVYHQATLSIDLGSPPEPGFIAGQFENDTEEIIAKRFLDANHIPTMGTWTLRVTLQNSGDCPGPTSMTPEEGPARLIACAYEDDDGEDLGNVFKVNRFQYTYFEPRVSRL